MLENLLVVMSAETRVPKLVENLAALLGNLLVDQTVGLLAELKDWKLVAKLVDLKAVLLAQKSVVD